MRFEHRTRKPAQAIAGGLERLTALMERQRARHAAPDPVKASLYAAKAQAARDFLAGQAGPRVSDALQREARGRRMSPDKLARTVIDKHEAAQAAAFILSDIEREAAVRIRNVKTVAEVTAILAETEQSCAAL